MNRLSLFARLLRFRDDLMLLWRGFQHPETPLHLKAAMVGVLAYVISPIDILPDFLPLLGIVDDVALVAFAVGWIARRLPESVTRPAGAKPRGNGPIIDGNYRRL